MEKIKRSELSKIRMAGGNEKKYPKVIVDGMLLQWVAIGWVEKRKATKRDYTKYPEAED